VNRLAVLWSAHDELAAYFCDLLFSRREGRQGFSFNVLAELVDLQSHASRRSLRGSPPVNKLQQSHM